MEYQERTTDHGQATGKLSLAAASRVHLFCNLQSRARTHAVLVIGLYELLLSHPFMFLMSFVFVDSMWYF